MNSNQKKQKNRKIAIIVLKNLLQIALFVGTNSADNVSIKQEILSKFVKYVTASS